MGKSRTIGDDEMKYIELILTLPIAIISLLLLMVADLIRTIQGKPTFDEEWHEVYMDSNLNHGQGRINND